MTSAYALDRTALRRVIAVANGKGGVGKTSLATHLAAKAAAAGWRTLLLDFDPQGNTADDLGYTGDNGAGIVHAVHTGTAPPVVKDVRPSLDVVPGGVELNELADMLISRRMRRRDGDESALLKVARSVALIAGNYDLVVADCPPANSDVLQDAVLEMAEYLLIPTKSDQSSRNGIIEMARRFQYVRAHGNPDLKLMGIVLFGITGGAGSSRGRAQSATSVRQAARLWIEDALRGQAPVYRAMVRHVEAVAVDIRDKGLLAHELAATAGTGPKARPVIGLARDYHGVAAETFERLAEMEAAA